MDIKNTVTPVEGGIQVVAAKPTTKADVPVVDKVADPALDAKDVEKSKASLSLVLKKEEKEKVDISLSEVEQFFQSERRQLSFTINKISKDVVIEVKDSTTGELIRQIPSELVVKLAERLEEMSDGDSSGFLLKDKA